MLATPGWSSQRVGEQATRWFPGGYCCDPLFVSMISRFIGAYYTKTSNWKKTMNQTKEPAKQVTKHTIGLIFLFSSEANSKVKERRGVGEEGGGQRGRERN